MAQGIKATEKRCAGETAHVGANGKQRSGEGRRLMVSVQDPSCPVVPLMPSGSNLHPVQAISRRLLGTRAPREGGWLDEPRPIHIHPSIFQIHRMQILLSDGRLRASAGATDTIEDTLAYTGQVDFFDHQRFLPECNNRTRVGFRPGH
jgi:hypothetical protein